MSNLNTLSGGYKGGSPRVRSNNSKKPQINQDPKKIDLNLLIDDLKRWYADGNLTKDGLNILKEEINKLVL